MIAEKIIRKDLSTIAEQVMSATDYIAKDFDRFGNNKVEYIGSRNLYGNNYADMQLEMIMTAQTSKKAKKPIEHWVLSYRENENPTPQDLQQAIDVFLNELNYQNCQVLYAVHNNTKHKHIHIVINRVILNDIDVNFDKLNSIKNKEIIDINTDIATEFKSKCIDNKHDYYSALKATAKIELLQNLEPVTDNPFIAKFDEKNNQILVENNPNYNNNKQDKKEQKINKLIQQQSQELKEKITDEENITKIKTGYSMIVDKIPEIIKQSNSWLDFHKNLATIGVKYDKKGSGAVFKINIDGSEQIHKATSIYHGASISKLKKLWGDFVERPENLIIETLNSEPTDETKNIPNWAEFVSLKSKFEIDRKNYIKQIKQIYQKKYEDLLQRQKLEREKLFSYDWTNKGKQLNLQRKILADKHKKDKLYLTELRNLEVLKSKNLQHILWVEYNNGKIFDTFATTLKNSSNDYLYNQKYIEPKPENDLLNFNSEVINISKNKIAVNYFLKNNPEKTYFTDIGNKIQFYHKDNLSILASLQLAQRKWDNNFKINGSENFVKQCIKIVAEQIPPIIIKKYESEINNIIIQKQKNISQQNKTNSKNNNPDNIKPENIQCASDAIIAMKRGIFTYNDLIPEMQINLEVIKYHLELNIKILDEVFNKDIPPSLRKSAEVIQIYNELKNIYFPDVSDNNDKNNKTTPTEPNQENKPGKSKIGGGKWS